MSKTLNIVDSTKDNTKCDSTDNKSYLNKNMFEFNYIIGKGGFGKVWRVKYKKTNEIFALKEMSKRKIIDKKSEKSINNERVFLSKLHHPFLVNMHFAFQDRDNLYLVIDILYGGDLRFHCSRYRKFSEEQTRFFIACLVHTLSYIHQNNVIHRDIKPENLVLDDKGYLHITDFGIAKENNEDNSSETSGTPGYMAPEVMRGLGHSFTVDYFAIGVIGYEFMIGKRPYNGKNRKEIKEQMFSHQAKIKRNEIVKGWSLESRDFINKLLKRKPEHRLGSKDGIKELKEHYWLKYYPWNELENKILPGPFIPEKKDNFDKKCCEGIDKISESTRLRYEEIAKSDNYKIAFVNFYFNKEEIIKNNNIQNNTIQNNNNQNNNIQNNNIQNNNIQNNINLNNNKSNINNNNSSSGKKLFGDYSNNFNSPMSTNDIINFVPKIPNTNIIFKQSNIVKEKSKNNSFYNNYLNNNQYSKNKNIKNNLNKKINQRPFTSKNRIKKEIIKKSSSQKLYKEIKPNDKSLYSLLNSNSGFITIKNIKKDNINYLINNNGDEENKIRIKFEKNINKNNNNKNNSFCTIGLLKKDLKCKNNFLINNIVKDYHSNEKKSTIEWQSLKEDILNNQQSISFLQNQSRNNSNLKNSSGKNNSELFLFNNIRNKILYKQIYKNNINNSTLENKKNLFNNGKRNNSFYLNKKNNNLDLSSIRLCNLKNNSIINNNRNFYKKNIYQLKGQTSRRDNNYNSCKNFFQEIPKIIKEKDKFIKIE